MKFLDVVTMSAVSLTVYSKITRDLVQSINASSIRLEFRNILGIQKWTKAFGRDYYLEISTFKHKLFSFIN